MSSDATRRCVLQSLGIASSVRRQAIWVPISRGPTAGFWLRKLVRCRRPPSVATRPTRILALLDPKRIRLPQPFDSPTDRTSQLRAVRVMPLISLVFLVSLLSACDGDDGGKWSTCEGYREDVTSGSAQDLRDSRNGRNPCD